MSDLDKYAHAATIIADLKQAGGWDLTGWEIYFAELPPDLATRDLAPLANRHMRLFADGIWFDMGAVDGFTAERKHDYLDVMAFNTPFVKRVAGIRSPMEVNFRLTLDMVTYDWLMERHEAREPVKCQIGMDDFQLEVDFFLNEVTVDIGAGRLVEIRVHAYAHGEAILTENP